jgi:membrane protease YdiL (CAAX protease family)
MLAAVFILIFPLVAGAVFGVLYLARHRFGASVSFGGATDLVVYAVTLIIPLAVVGGTLVTGETLTLADLGLRWPHIATLGPAAATVVNVLGGGGVAVAGYYAEKAFQYTTHGALPVSSESTDVEYLMDGASRVGKKSRGEAGLDEDAGPRSHSGISPSHNDRAPVRNDDRIQQVGAALVLGASGFAAVVEEMLWRGYLLAYAQTTATVTAGMGLVISAVAFGSNHAYFGWRNVVSKSILGLVWGGLFLVTGSLVAPIVSHLAFNTLALDVKVNF